MPSTHLTQREHQVLRYIVNGATSREVATQLNLSVQTVEAHRFSLMKKLTVKNMAQLITRALKTSLML
ncbi:LuxR C-terminal-related transcriptional regulator [Nitrospira sp. Nam74]